MKIVFLNSWYATVGRGYYDFIKKESPSTDIFCLSEVHPEMFSKIQKILVGFSGFYEKGEFDPTTKLIYGQAIFAGENINLKMLGKVKFGGRGMNKMSFAFPVLINSDDNSFYLMNVHGVSRPGTKLDTPVRVRQSQKIIDYFKNISEPKIIGGDFNLMPETRSVKMIEKAGYRSLIKDFGIKNTRNKLSWEQFNNYQYFADYCFVSKDVKVVDFKVPYNEISDHLPLILDFEV